MHASHQTYEELDALQRRFLDCLSATEGRPLTFQQLRARGFENPAMLCYELEIAGIELSRFEGSSDHSCAVALPARLASVQSGPRERLSERMLARAREALDRLAVARRHTREAQPPSDEARPPRDPAEPPSGLPQLPSGLARDARRTLGHLQLRYSRNRRAALLGTVLALAAVAAVGWALALTGSSPSSSSRRASARGSALGPRASARRPAAVAATSRRKTVTASRPQAAATHAPSPSATSAAAPAGTNEVTAAALESHGHALLAEGRYAAAIAQLRSALAASGGSLSRCEVPASEACLTYAYALFDLGRALELSGEAHAAVEVLEQRMRIDNQRGIVAETLAGARRLAARS